MKALIKISELTAALARLKTIVGGRPMLPILGNVLIVAQEEGRLLLTATDLEQYLTLTVEADVSEPGMLTVPCGRLQAALAKMDGDEVELQGSAKNVLTGKANGMRFELLGLPAEEMPKLPAIDGAAEVQFPEGVLAEAIGRELGAVSGEETRYVLNGIFIAQEGGCVQLVATDGRRLALTELVGYKQQSLSVIVPTRACQQMACLDGGGATRLRVTETQIEASGHGWNLISKRIEGNYPNWKQVMPPEGAAHGFLVDREKFSEALAFAAVICTAKNEAVHLKFEAERLLVSSSTPDIGEAEAEVLAEITGSEMLVAFNPLFVLSALKAMEGPTITGEMQDEMSPLRMTDGKSVHVLMPMRVS